MFPTGKARAAVVEDEEEEDDRNLGAHPTIEGGLGNQHSRTQRSQRQISLEGGVLGASQPQEPGRVGSGADADQIRTLFNEWMTRREEEEHRQRHQSPAFQIDGTDRYSEEIVPRKLFLMGRFLPGIGPREGESFRSQVYSGVNLETLLNSSQTLVNLELFSTWSCTRGSVPTALGISSTQLALMGTW
jgi:hypothetical protein